MDLSKLFENPTLLIVLGLLVYLLLSGKLDLSKLLAVLLDAFKLPEARRELVKPEPFNQPVTGVFDWIKTLLAGMDFKTILLVGGMALMAFMALSGGCGPKSATAVDRPAIAATDYGLKSAIPPTLAGRRADALQLAAVADEFARVIAFDGQLESPKILTTRQLGETFGAINDYAFSGRVLAPPGFAQLTADVVTREIDPGPESRQVDAELRRKAVEIWQEIAAGCRAVQ